MHYFFNTLIFVLMQAVDYIDVLIPRGGARLIQTVKEKSKVPVIETGVGNCHIYSGFPSAINGMNALKEVLGEGK